MIHNVQSPQLYILWPEDGPVHGPKHVISLNKNNNINSCVLCGEVNSVKNTAINI